MTTAIRSSRRSRVYRLTTTSAATGRRRASALAKKWAEALAAGAEKQQPLGGYRGEDVAAKNPFTKALAARGRLAVAS